MLRLGRLRNGSKMRGSTLQSLQARLVRARGLEVSLGFRHYYSGDPRQL